MGCLQGTERLIYQFLIFSGKICNLHWMLKLLCMLFMFLFLYATTWLGSGPLLLYRFFCILRKTSSTAPSIEIWMISWSSAATGQRKYGKGLNLVLDSNLWTSCVGTCIREQW
jgi:hypothetical protein